MLFCQLNSWVFHNCFILYCELHEVNVALSALMSFVGRLEEHLGCKKCSSNKSLKFTVEGPSITWSNSGKVGLLYKVRSIECYRLNLHHTGFVQHSTSGSDSSWSWRYGIWCSTKKFQTSQTSEAVSVETFFSSTLAACARPFSKHRLSASSTTSPRSADIVCNRRISYIIILPIICICDMFYLLQSVVMYHSAFMDFGPCELFYYFMFLSLFFSVLAVCSRLICYLSV